MKRTLIENSVLYSALLWAILFFTNSESALSAKEQRRSEEANCNYEDTVNITGSRLLRNGSFLFHGHLISPELTGFYDYEILYGNERIPVARHLRGCICQVTACVQFCCHPRATKIRGVRDCSPESDRELNYSPFFNVTDSNGETYERHLHNDFFIQQRLPCERGYLLDEGVQLVENGTLYLLTNNQNESGVPLTKSEYCLVKAPMDGSYLLTPLICFPPNPPVSVGLIVNFSLMIVSIPLMVATICVYALIKELRNLHGKCLIAYLTAMTTGDILLNINTLLGLLNEEITDRWCCVIGYLAYFFIISGFFWLSIISFDLWYNFRGTNTRGSRLIQQRRFFGYCLVGTFFPVLFTAATIVAQNSDLNPAFKSGVGEGSCWIDVTKWSAMIYFYGPMMFIIVFNSTMFILTYTKIYRVQKELSRFGSKEEKNRHLRCEKDNFSLFLRLFVIMGVTWIFEVLSFFAGTDSKYFYFTDALNSAIGIIIFVLFVMKRRVVTLIRKRLGRNTGQLEVKVKDKNSTRTSNVHESGVSLTQNTDV